MPHLGPDRNILQIRIQRGQSAGACSRLVKRCVDSTIGLNRGSSDGGPFASAATSAAEARIDIFLLAARALGADFGYAGSPFIATHEANAQQEYTAPHLLLSGPNYSSKYSGSILRMGEQGELNRLVEGQDLFAFRPQQRTEEIIESYLQDRINSIQVIDPNDQLFHQSYQRSQQQLRDLINRRTSLDLDSQNNGIYGVGCNENFMSQASIALDFFEQGLSRCAMVEDQGYCHMRWDSHGDVREQDWHYELLFTGLIELMEELNRRTAPSGATLAEETTVVLCSELGRHPALNEMGGRHHWPIGSAMLIGGVTGSRTVGGFTDQMLSKTIDPFSAEFSSTGEKILPGHLGATLLALADIDPMEFTSYSPLWNCIL